MASSAARHVANLKQVHIKMVPSPRTLAESQLVLAAIRKFGEVSYFLNLKNTPSRDAKNTGRSALAIFEDPQARNAALEASPVVVPIPSLSTLFPSSFPRDSDGDQYPTKSSLAKPRIKAKTKEARMNKAREKEKEQISTSDVNQPQPSILCYIEPSYHDHGVAVKQNPYHNTFLITSNSVEVQDLLQTANGRNARGRYKRGAHSRRRTTLFWVGYVDCFPKKKRPVPFRHQINAMRFAESLHGDSLMRLWREGREIAEKEKLASVASEKVKEEAQESPSLSRINSSNENRSQRHGRKIVGSRARSP
ncbi:uncharacterized protein BDCG_01422 [Blastomyces dermatitidis ER-3]|uniref:Uncharacterized protein n=1 Tax=Ajellomyces dermatitidis (strain ER-3 / ATCC MYA-2586) TaxID=559297 RepID=A0ABP2EVH1_AJEDR|nr:uncharacterized protein BDCG_01422 [Blastomyces dermatitidis ER-3]EEQ86302.2 hypothetical protein BDCG_01422 [Blastomyces dermatitidis ER-3]